MKYRAKRNINKPEEEEIIVHEGELFDDITEGLALVFDENNMANSLIYLESESTGFSFGILAAEIEDYFEKVED